MIIVVKDEPDVLEGIFRLRHEVYVVEKGWVPDDGNQKELDKYDEYARYVAVLQPNEISGAARVIASARFISLENKIMLDDEFRELVAGVDLIREGAIEITRIVIDRKYRNQGLDALLYQKLIQWSYRNHVAHWYFVVERKYLRYLNRLGIMAVQIGREKIFPDGVRAVAAYIDLKYVLEVLQSTNERLFRIVAA